MNAAEVTWAEVLAIAAEKRLVFDVPTELERRAAFCITYGHDFRPGAQACLCCGSVLA